MNLDRGRAIDASLKGNAARFINHSCDPNCEARQRCVPVRKSKSTYLMNTRIVIFTIKPIEKGTAIGSAKPHSGDELTFNYHLSEVENARIARCLRIVALLRTVRRHFEVRESDHGGQNEAQEESPEDDGSEEATSRVVSFLFVYCCCCEHMFISFVVYSC